MLVTYVHRLDMKVMAKKTVQILMSVSQTTRVTRMPPAKTLLGVTCAPVMKVTMVTDTPASVDLAVYHTVFILGHSSALWYCQFTSNLSYIITKSLPTDVNIQFIVILRFSDINECLRPEAYPCPEGANCINTVGSYVCNCPDGYTLEGDTCVGKLAFCYCPKWLHTRWRYVCG